jgi:molecular chaperone GrpE (heat shock protein)
MKMNSMQTSSTTSTTPAFMTQAGYERGLKQFQVDREHWKRIQERMKRQQEEQNEEWKRKDAEMAKINEVWDKARDHQLRVERDHAEIKKYTQQEIDEAIRQIRMERLKNLLNPYV